MAERLDFIVFSDDWGRHPFSCQHIMMHLLPHHNVLWVNTIGMRRPQLTVRDLKRSIHKLRSFASPSAANDSHHNLTIIDPIMLPFGNRLACSFNQHSVLNKVMKAMHSLKMNKPIILTTLPNAADYLGFLGEQLIVYYCVDDFTLWPGVNEKLVLDMEQRLLRQADLLICSSPELAVAKSNMNLKTLILPHGVDFDHFSRCAFAPPLPISNLAALPKPVIGYFGLLGEWVNLEILESLASAHPDWGILLMGDVIVSATRLANLPNIHFTGPIPYSDLPNHVAYTDVLIIPYHVSKRGRTITPLKLREYMATGKPIVSTAIPECQLFSSYITIASTISDFIAAVENAIHDTPDKSLARQQRVAQESWQSRAMILYHYVSEALVVKRRVNAN